MMLDNSDRLCINVVISANFKRSPKYFSKSTEISEDLPSRAYHRVDSVIESSLREIIGSKNVALINLSLNFCETTIYDNKVFLENLVAVH